MTADPFSLHSVQPPQGAVSVEPENDKPAEKAADSGGEGRVRGVAFAGRPVVVHDSPAAPSWPESTAEDGYVPDEDIDASDLSVVNLEMNRCRSRLFRVSHSMKDAQRSLREAELAYNRQMRRALVQVSGGTAEIRRAVAELECEEFENDVVVKQQIVEELKKRAQDVRDDLKAVENLSHNARAQMDIR